MPYFFWIFGTVLRLCISFRWNQWNRYETFGSYAGFFNETTKWFWWSSDGKKSNLIKAVLIVAGTLSVGLGILGVFLPLLPTTPFLLLAAALYAKSSIRFYRWLLKNRTFGSYIKNYREGRGIPLKTKIMALSLLWITIAFSAFYIINIIRVRVILILIAAGVSVHILSIRTMRKDIDLWKRIYLGVIFFRWRLSGRA
jgi:uncharacterized protein